jgi:hypothetical protein
MATTLTDTRGVVALAAAGVAAVALLTCVALLVKTRRLARNQRLLMGEHGERDLVAHAAELHQAFEALRSYVDELAASLDARLAGVESTLRNTFAHRALVRYDAYNELSGKQSVSIALLDDERSGLVLSCIHHRDQARVYAKAVNGGQGELELSPEEAEAVRIALSSPADTGETAEQLA